MRWRNQAQSTIDQRRRCLQRIERFTGTEPQDLTYLQILEFRDRLTRAGQPLSIAGQAMELAHLRAFFKWCILEDVRDDDPMIRVPQPRLPRWLPHPIPEGELHHAISTARERIRPFFFLGAYAGLRACEMAPLRGEDLWWHMDPPLLHVRRGKGGDPRTVPISPVLETELRPLAKRGWLFPRLTGEVGPVPAHLVSHLANDHLHASGSSHTLHSTRHRFGTMIYRLSGGDLRLTQELMGHRSVQSTVVYTQVDQSQAAGVVNSLPNLRLVG
jgi:site-specific recombinase XerD